MSRFRATRRSVLRAAALPLALPWLESVAVAAPAPRRVIFFITPGGTVPRSRVQGTETAFTLGANLAALEPHRKDLVILDGVDVEAAHQSLEHRGDGAGHASSGCLLTGRKLTKGGPLDDGDGYKVNVHGPSIDHVLAQKLGASDRFPVLATRVAPTAFDREGHMLSSFSWKTLNQPAPADPDPKAVFARVFADAGAASSDDARKALAEQQRRRKSILDATLDGLGALGKRVSAADRQRLAAHEAAIRALESRLAAAPEPGAVCRPVPPAAGLDPRDESRSPEIGRAFMKEIALAFSCRLTRIAILQWSRCSSRSSMTYAGVPTEFHQLQHDRRYAELDKIYGFFAGEMARLITELQNTPDEGGTVFDNTLVVWISELADAAAHTERGHQWVLAGSCGGRVRTGRYLKLARPDSFHNNLLVSIMNAMGAAETTFGDAAYCTGPMRALGV